MITDFTLAAGTEMISTELPVTERVRRIDDLGWNASGQRSQSHVLCPEPFDELRTALVEGLRAH